MHGGGDSGEQQGERDPFEGTEKVEGYEAEVEAGRVAREARHAKGGSDPLEGLVERVTADPTAAFDPVVLRAAAEFETEEVRAFYALVGRLKEIKGLRLTSWREAIKVVRRQMKKEAEDAERKARAAVSAAQRAAREIAAVAEAEERARAASAVGEELRDHFAGPATVNGASYNMEPGRTWCERWKGSGDNAVSITDELADFSAKILAHVHEVVNPGAAPHTVFDLSIKIPGENKPRSVMIPAEDFRRMDWVETRAPGAVVLETGRREHLRIAIEKLSPVSKRKHRFCYRGTGWFEPDGVPTYVTAGGAISAAGHVPDVRTEPSHSGDKVALFALPSTVGTDRQADLRALVKLLEIEPAHVALPCLGLSVRATMGNARNAVHVWGESRVGKSRLASMFWRLFGPSMHFKNPPASWAIDSPLTILSRMSRVGDAVLGVSDMQPDTPGQNVEMVFRSLFNNTAPGRMRREGGEREVGALRASVLSDGERSVRGPSLPSRVAVLFLERRFTPNPDGAGGLEELAASGALARGMAQIIEGYAPRYAQNLLKLPLMERETGAAWGLNLNDRDAEVFFPLALGIEALLRVLRSAEVIDADAAEKHRRRAAEALRTAAQASRAGADEQRPGVVALDAIGAAIRSCSNDGAHVGATRIMAGRRERHQPPHPERWGYSPRGESAGPGLGARVGVRTWEDPTVVVLDPAVALSVAKRWAPRVCGAELPVGTVRELGEALKAAKLIARSDEGRPGGKARAPTGELGSRARLEGFAVLSEALGIDLTDDPPDLSPTPDKGPDHPAEDNDFDACR